MPCSILSSALHHVGVEHGEEEGARGGGGARLPPLVLGHERGGALGRCRVVDGAEAGHEQDEVCGVGRVVGGKGRPAQL